MANCSPKCGLLVNIIMFNFIKLEKRQFLWLSFTLVLSLLFFFFSWNLVAAQEKNGFLATLFLEAINVLLVSIPAALAGLAGMLLNLTITYLVVDMGNLINNTSGLGFAINNLWKVIRDAMNILFIFGLVFIGIKTILDSNDSSTRKALVSIIGAAFLINFSLFITKAIIDFTNTVAVQVFILFSDVSQIDPESIGGGISGAFMQALGVLSFLTASNFENFTFTGGIVFSFMTMIFLLIVMFVFATGAFLLLARFVILIMYMIFSPVMFLGWILPKFAQYSTKWWTGFLSQAFLAPAYLFMLYISYIAIERFRINQRVGDSLGEVLQETSKMDIDTFYVVLVFAFAAAMLIASLLVAKQMGAVGAGSTIKFMDGIQKNIRGNMQSAVGRRTVGWVGNKLAERTKQNEGTAAGRARNKWMSRATLGTFDTQARIKAGDKMAGSTFGGSRSYSSQQKWAGERQALQASGEQKEELRAAVNAYREMKKRGEEDTQIIAAMEKAVADTNLSVITDIIKNDKDGVDFVKTFAGELSESRIKALRDDKELNVDVMPALDTARSTQITERLGRLHANSSSAKLGETIHKASVPELQAIGLEQVLPYAQFLTSQQIKDWKELTTTEKVNLKNARAEQLRKTFADGENAKVIFDRFKSDKERAQLPDFILNNKESAPYVSPRVLIEVFNNTDLESEVLSEIKNSLLSYYDGTVHNTTEDNQRGDDLIEFFRHDHIGKLF